MKIKSQISVTLVALVFLIGCSKPDSDVPMSKKEFGGLFKKFIPVTALEAAGFEHISPADFDLLLSKDSIYILCMQDRLIAKFEGNTLRKIYKAPKGQGPRDMLAPKSIFFYHSDSIAVHDYQKRSIILFDNDLNFLREIKKLERVLEITGTDYGVVAFLADKGNVFGFLDDSFNITESFVKENQKIPFNKFYSTWLNQGFFVNGGLVAHSYALQPEKECQVDIYELDKKKKVVSLEWEQPYTPTQESIEARKDVYFTIFVGKMKEYFVVQNYYFKYLLNGIRDHDLLIFNESGKLLFKSEFPYQVLRMVSESENSKLYVMDEDEDISFIDIMDIIN